MQLRGARESHRTRPMTSHSCSQQRRRVSQVLHELQHKNIVKLQDAYETPTSLILVCELATGGELMHHPNPNPNPNPNVTLTLNLSLALTLTLTLTLILILTRRADAPDRRGALRLHRGGGEAPPAGDARHHQVHA